MTVATLPLQLLLLTVSGWVHRHQQDVIAYLVEENRVLKEQLGGRKLRLTDDQRRRLAAKARLLGRRALDAVATLVTPDTLMRWHRRLIAWKWTYVARRVGRPGLRQAISDLIVRMARENDRWGYCRMQGELRKLGHRVAASTIGKVLKDHGIRPAPDRPTSWRTFLRAHWGEVAGMDFFTTEVWTPLGLTTYYILFLIDLKTRRAHVAGLTTTPDGAFMAQVARNLTDPEDGFLRAHHFVICDRDAKFTAEFRRILQAVGVRVIRTPRQAPNCNAHAERFVLSIKSECLNRMMFFGEASLRRAVGANMGGDPLRDEQVREGVEHIGRSQAPCDDQRETFPRVLIDDREDLQRPAIVGPLCHEVVRPNVVAGLGPPADARAVSEPQAPPLRLFLGHFQPLASPKPFHAFVIHSPAFARGPLTCRRTFRERSHRPGAALRDQRIRSAPHREQPARRRAGGTGRSRHHRHAG